MSHDRRRYLIVASVTQEIVNPLLQKRLENDYRNQGFGTFQNFINSQPVLHKLFHLRHRNAKCCKDQHNCTNTRKLPLNYQQWDILYTENPGPGGHNCHCIFTAKSVTTEDLDITLASLILLKCCSLPSGDIQAISTLRQYKNEYLSHNVRGGITETEYNSFWPDLTKQVLQLDSSKRDDLTRIENRPLDEALCRKYQTCILDIHKKLDEVNATVDEMHIGVNENNATIKEMHIGVNENNVTIKENNVGIKEMHVGVKENNVGISENNVAIKENRKSIHELDKSVQVLDNTVQVLDNTVQVLDNTVQVLDNSFKGLENTVQELLTKQSMTPEYLQIHKSKKAGDLWSKPKPYKLGQDIFYRFKQIDLSKEISYSSQECIDNGILLDNGQCVLCLHDLKRLLICNIEGENTYYLDLQEKPMNVTAVNTNTVAVTFYLKNYIEIYDIEKKAKLKSILLPGRCSGITFIKDKIVVGGHRCIWIVDHQIEQVIKTIQTDYYILENLYASHNMIFYCGYTKHLHFLDYPDGEMVKIELPSVPRRMTALPDGSLYVDCEEHSVQHVSTDGKYVKVKTKGLKSKSSLGLISYNICQGKLLTCSKTNPFVIVFHEI